MKRLAVFVLLLGAVTVASRADGLNGVFTYQNGSQTYLNVPTPTDIETTAVGIDNAGAVLLSNDNSPDVLYNPKTNVVTPIALQGAMPGSTNFALAIAGNGTVLGTNIYYTRDFFIQNLNGSTALINLPIADGFPVAINNKGIVAGILADASAGFLFNTRTGVNTNVLSGPPFSANVISINDRGQLIYSVGSQDYILNRNGTTLAINLPSGCHAKDMNDYDQIVGTCAYSEAGSKEVIEGFLLSGGRFSTINYVNSDQNYTEVTGINNKGEIVGMYQDVPEPGTVSLLGIGLLALSWFKKTF